MVDSAFDDRVDSATSRLAAAVDATGCTVATAESLTGGQLAAAISAATNAGEWFRGGIVAYHPETKYGLLQAPLGPVVRGETAAAMARSAVELLDARYAVALTGVGGPDPSEGRPPGTVYIATCARGADPRAEHHRFMGEPLEVMEQTIVAALEALTDRILE